MPKPGEFPEEGDIDPRIDPMHRRPSLWRREETPTERAHRLRRENALNDDGTTDLDRFLGMLP